MSVPYCDLSQEEWGELLLTNSNIQRGGSLIGFRGTPFQRGHGFGSILKSIFRVAAPFTKKLLKGVAKEGLSTAVGIGSDLLEGRNLKESVTDHSKAAGKRLLKKGIKSAKKRLQSGSGIGRAKKKSIKGRKKRQVGYGKREKNKSYSNKIDYLGD